MDEEPRRISYMALANGTAVRASGGEQVGVVEHVLQVPEVDVFDGIVVKTPAGLRFADADQIADITDRYVTLSITGQEAANLAAPDPGAPSFHADPLEDAGSSLHDRFGRMFGRSHWKRD